MSFWAPQPPWRWRRRLAFVGLILLDPLLVSITSTGTANGTVSTTVTGKRARGLLLLAAVILVVSFALFAGGFVAGRPASARAGLDGIVTGVLLVAVPFVWLLGTIAFVLLEPAWSPGHVYGRSENLRMLVAALVVYSVVSPVFVLASFSGGRVGGRVDRGNAGIDLQSR